MVKERSLLLFQLILVGIMWGASFNAGKYIVEYFPPMSAASWRFSLATLFMVVALILFKGLNKEVLKQNKWTYISMGIVGVLGFNSLFFLGLTQTSPINGALIMGTNPIVTVIFSYFLLKMKINKVQVIGFFISLIGVVLVISKASLSVLLALSFSIGDIYILLGNICWAVYGVLGKKYLKNSSVIMTSSMTMGVGTLFLILLGLFEVKGNYNYVGAMPISGWLAMLFLSFGASFLAYFWWNKGIKTIGANNTSIFYNLVPASSILISFISGHKIFLGQIIGCIIVIFGVTLVLRSDLYIKDTFKRKKSESPNF